LVVSRNVVPDSAGGNNIHELQQIVAVRLPHYCAGDRRHSDRKEMDKIPVHFELDLPQSQPIS